MEMDSDNDIDVPSAAVCLVKKGPERKLGSPHQLKSQSHLKTNGKAHLNPSDHKLKMTNGNARGNTSASFSTNSNSVVCLPLVSEGLKLVWTQSDQTKELDTIPELVQAFNVFPYPTSQEVSALAHVCGLPLDKVKVWFMVQRIKYGISWASEDIEETRCKLAKPECESEHEETKKRKKSGCDDLLMVDEGDRAGDSEHCLSLKKQKKDSKELEKVSPSPTHSSSPHSPPQNSIYSSHPADNSATTPLTASPSSLDSSLGSQQKHGRYKKSKAQLAALRKSFLQENWPAETELRRLQEETGLTRNEIRKWFSDSRYQLRTGRGMPGSTPSEPPQPQPLSLVTKKHQSGVPLKGEARSKRAQKSGSCNSHFFQTFLSNTLEAFGGGEVELSETRVAKEDSNIQNDEVGSEHESEAQDAEALSEPSMSTSSLCITPPQVFTQSPQKTISKSLQVSRAVGRVRKTKEQLDILKEYFLRCPWPKSEEYTEVVELTALPRADVIQWFGDTRYAVKNGQLRWVRGMVRDHILAEIALQQNGGGADTSNSSGTPKSEGSRKRKSQLTSASKVPKSTSDSLNIHPLEMYHQQMGALQEKDLDALCRKSKMSYQQVRDWFASKDTETPDLEHSITDD